MINCSIDLSKIDKSKIKEGKNGAKYYDFVVDQRKEPDQYGKTHTVYESQTKEEREAKKTKNYIGGGKEYVFGGTTTKVMPDNTPTKAEVNNDEPETMDSLPF